MAAKDQDFKGAFSFLPPVIKLTKALSTNSPDPQQQAQLIQSIVNELQSQVQRCQQLLEECPALDHTPQEQITLLDRNKKELQLKCALLRKYQELGLVS